MTTETTVIRDELARQAAMARTLLEDVERRVAQGSPPALTAVACRALQSTTVRLLELAAELVGAEPRA